MNLIEKIGIYFICLIFLYLSWINPVNAAVLSNEKVTISIGNEQSWTGRNGTGNLSYYGCDRNCQCVYLSGGTITCRNGVCITAWQNKNVSYTLSSPITKDRSKNDTLSTLIISSGDRTIANEKLHPKAFDNAKPRT